MPERVAATGLKKLPGEKQTIAPSAKTMAYQVETEIHRELSKHYGRWEEGRTPLQSIYQTAGDLEVREGELVMSLQGLSSPHRMEVLRKLWEEYTSWDVCFPGTNPPSALPGQAGK